MLAESGRYTSRLPLATLSFRSVLGLYGCSSERVSFSCRLLLRVVRQPIGRKVDVMFSLGLVGAGQFAGQFAKLFRLHPEVGDIHVTDLLPGAGRRARRRESLAGTAASFEALLDSDVDAVALFTQRWTHGPLAVQALRAGKHVYSAVPMAVSVEEIAAIIEAVRETGLTYMMGETSYYNPATVYARQKLAEGAFGRVFYAEGDYVHDMDLGFYAAYQYSGGEDWKSTASYPPMMYPTHSVGGVLGAIGGARGQRQLPRRPGPARRRRLRQGRSASSATTSRTRPRCSSSPTAAIMRINEMRRVGYPSHLRESRFRYFGTEAQLRAAGDGQRLAGQAGCHRRLRSWSTRCRPCRRDDPALAEVAPELRDAFISGSAPVHDTCRLAVGVPRCSERTRGQPPLPGRRLRPRRRRRHAAAGQRLDRRPLQPARHRGARVGARAAASGCPCPTSATCAARCCNRPAR